MAKAQVSKKTKSCKTGWNCGKSCITKSKKCRKRLSKDGKQVALDFATFVKIAGGEAGRAAGADQEVGLEPKARAGGSSAPKPEPKAEPAKATKPKAEPEPKAGQPNYETAKSNFKKIGEGIEGEVFDDGKGGAVKYVKKLNVESLRNQGLPEDYIQDRLKEDAKVNKTTLENLDRYGKLGIGPKVLDNYEDTGHDVTKMELLKGYDNGIDDTRATVDNLLKNLKTAHENDLIVEDLHEDNVMFNAETKDVKFIDQGGSFPNATNVEKADQLLNTFGWRPLAANQIERYTVDPSVPKPLRTKLKKITRDYKRKVDSLDEKGAEKFVKDTYAVLDEIWSS